MSLTKEHSPVSSKSKCHGCKERYPGCDGVCEYGKARRAANEERRRQRYETRQREDDVRIALQSPRHKRR